MGGTLMLVRVTKVCSTLAKFVGGGIKNHSASQSAISCEIECVRIMMCVHSAYIHIGFPSILRFYLNLV